MKYKNCQFCWGRAFPGGGERKTMHSSMNDDLTKFSLSNFLAGESNDPLQAPASFTKWVHRRRMGG